MSAAVCRQSIHRTAQIGNRLALAHPLLQERDKRRLVKIQIGSLQDEVLHRKRRIIMILLIRRRPILHTDLRRQQLTCNIRLRPRKRRRGICRRPRTEHRRAEQRCCAPMRLLPSAMIHSTMHDRTQLLHDAVEHSSSSEVPLY